MLARFRVSPRVLETTDLLEGAVAEVDNEQVQNFSGIELTHRL